MSYQALTLHSRCGHNTVHYTKPHIIAPTKPYLTLPWHTLIMATCTCTTQELWCVTGTCGQNQGMLRKCKIWWCRVLYSGQCCGHSNQGRALRSHKSPPILASAAIWNNSILKIILEDGNNSGEKNYFSVNRNFLPVWFYCRKDFDFKSISFLQ